MSKIKYLFILILLKSSVTFCQENIGIANSNYSPTSSVLLNPSSIVDSKVLWEINLIGASAFFDNNYLFLPTTSALSLISDPNSLPDLTDNFTSANKFGYIDASVHGPSAVFAIGKHSFGINTQLRSYTEIVNMPSHLAKFSFEGFKYLPQRGIVYEGSKTRLNTMTWAELGLNYGLIIKQQKKSLFLAGGSLKRLFGISHLGMNINNVNYQVPDTNDINFFNIDANYGFTAPAFNSGSGWSVDLGFTYKKTLDYVDSYVPYSKKHGCRKSDYKYKVGVSILDLGWINNKSDAFYGELDNQLGVWQNFSNSSFGKPQENDTKIIGSFPEVENQKRRYRTHLPTALSVQYDYNFENGFHVNATLVQSLSFTNQLGIRRQNLFAVTPRLELSRFEISLPLSLRKYTRPSVGVAVRFLNFFIIGTDNLLPIVQNQDVYSMDIYFSIKLTKLNTNKCKVKKKKMKHEKYKTNSCYFRQDKS